MSKDYYKILGVPKNASKEDIKKAFRKLAHEHHPDKKGGDETRFKEASEAYSVLSDDERRKKYDMFGSGDFAGAGAGGQGFGGFDFSNFSQGFNGFNGQNFEFDLGDIFGEFFGTNHRERNRENRGNDIQIDLMLDFSEAIFGGKKEISYSRNAKCETCEGSGGKMWTSEITCTKCSGKGKITEVKRSFFGNISSTKICNECRGSGKIPKEICSICKGHGTRHKKEAMSINIPSGVENGDTMKISGFGEAIKNGSSGDLYIRMNVRSHPIFKKSGQNLLMDLKIKISLAVLGGDIVIETLEGPLTIKIPERISTGEILRVKGKGVPYSSGGKRGDLMIKIIIEMPKHLSKNAHKIFEELRKEGI